MVRSVVVTVADAYNTALLIKQACLVKMPEYWPRFSVFCVFKDLDSLPVHKLVKQN